MIIAVVGATGRTGRYVVDRLVHTSHDVIAVGRTASRLEDLHPRASRAVADLGQPDALAEALAPAQRVVSLAHARFTTELLAALPSGCDRVVLTGSIRRDTALEDPAADQVREAEAAFERSGFPGTMLHPSMIYGASNDNNIGRLLGVIRRWPKRLPLVVPLPDRGRHTVQPVFVDDLADAVVAALLLPDISGPPISVVGPESMSYATLVRMSAEAVGRSARVVPGPPAGLVRLVERIVPLPLTLTELLRSTEDKSYDPTPMMTRLGVTPRPFAEGLRMKIDRQPEIRPGRGFS